MVVVQDGEFLFPHVKKADTFFRRFRGLMLRKRLEEQYHRAKDQLDVTARERDEAEKRADEREVRQADFETVLNCYESEKA